MADSKDQKSMRAWIYSSASGGLDKAMKLVEAAPQPPHQALPQDGILIQVNSMSPNPADYKIPEMGMLARALVSVPASPGMDYAGTVVKTGAGIAAKTFKVGDKVFGKVDPQRHGTLGTYITATYEGCAAVPEGVSLDEASCVATAGLSAYQCIKPYVKEGDKVFVNGGSGGVGTFGIQIAKALGCHVTASCSGKNAELVRGLGADEVIDYTKEDVSAVLRAKGPVFALAVDNVGTPADLYKAAGQFLLPTGTFVQIAADMKLASIKSIMSRSFLPSVLGGGKSKFVLLMVKPLHDDLVQMGRWMQEGKVKAVIEETFEFEDAPKAIAKLKLGRTRGNLVVRVSK
jgi:NADPH:quinone reductase-like Zn-dependent oxidoreductase